ncbi:MAG: aa3-type cytochrome oxidase subunit IV [Actinomycetota bacterium]
MSTFARICLSLGAFFAVAGTVYGLTSHEQMGTSLLLVIAGTWIFLGLVSRNVAHQAVEGGAGEEEPHVGPTIWPFGFAIAAVIIALGIIVTTWLLIAAAIVFTVSAAGWLREVARSRAHAGQP